MTPGYPSIRSFDRVLLERSGRRGDGISGGTVGRQMVPHRHQTIPYTDLKRELLVIPCVRSFPLLLGPAFRVQARSLS